MVLIIGEEEVSKLMDMKTTLTVVEAALKEQSGNRVLMPPRQVMKEKDSEAVVRVMAASAVGIKSLGLKALLGIPGKRRPGSTYFLTLVLDTSDASVLAIVAANRLTQLRTGAASGIASKYLARGDSETIGLLGAGVQGYGQLEGVATAMPIRRCLVYDPNTERVEALISRSWESLRVKVEKANAIEDLSTCDVLCTATPAQSPILLESHLRPGMHINAVGSNAPNRQEIDVGVIRRSRVFVDRIEQVLEEAGDLVIPVKQGLYDPKSIAGNLCDVVSGLNTGRETNSQITLFKSVGIALEDISVARKAYELAVENHVGLDVTL